jgi:Tol biopolymer transport system component
MIYKNNMTAASIIFMILAACSPISATPGQSPESSEASFSTPEPLPIQSPVIAIDNTGTMSPLPTDPIVQDCLNLVSNPPSAINGQVILYKLGFSDTPYLLNLRTSEKNLLPQSALQFRVSPDGTRVAFRNNSDTTKELILMDLFGNGTNGTFAWKVGWTEIQGWLDDNHLLISNKNEQQYPPYDLTILDIETGQTTEMDSDYPAMNIGYSFWNLSRAVYNTSLSHVIYQSSYRSSVLWDVTNNKEVTQIPSSTHNAEPIWLSDDQTALILGVLQSELVEVGDDFFLMSSYGILTRLTYLTDTYPIVDIGSFSISPDEQSVAFWLYIRSNVEEQELGTLPSYHLAILNLESGDIIDSCIERRSQGHPPFPIWSPDGNFLLLQDTNDEQNKILIANPNEGWFYNFSTGLFSDGWLNGE